MENPLAPEWLPTRAAFHLADENGCCCWMMIFHFLHDHWVENLHLPIRPCLRYCPNAEIFLVERQTGAEEICHEERSERSVDVDHFFSNLNGWHWHPKHCHSAHHYV